MSNPDVEILNALGEPREYTVKLTFAEMVAISRLVRWSAEKLAAAGHAACCVEALDAVTKMLVAGRDQTAAELAEGEAKCE